MLLKNRVVKDLLTKPKNIALIMTKKQSMLYNSCKIHASILKIRSAITAKENANDNTMAAEPLTTAWSVAINNSVKYNSFPSNAKIACV